MGHANEVARRAVARMRTHGAWVLGALAVALALPALVVAGSALNDDVIEACYVPGSGTIYRIKAEGLPDACHGTHVEFDWNQQGPQGEQGPSGLLDVQLVEAGLTVEDDSAPFGVRVSAECPAGYRIIGGGASLAFANGSTIWALSSSTPVPAGAFNNAGWFAEFETVDGASPVGTYIFFARAICALTG